MSEIINLRQKRKDKARVEKDKQAEQNRRLHGRTKAEKQKQKLETDRAERHLSGHEREKDGEC